MVLIAGNLLVVIALVGRVGSEHCSRPSSRSPIVYLLTPAARGALSKVTGLPIKELSE
jgi:hypothetical protein